MTGVTAGPTTIEVTENVTTITATGDQISIDLTDDVTTIQAYSLAIPTALPGGIDASAVTVTPYNTITSSYLDGALKELADQSFRGSTTPTTNVEEGDTWYDTANDIFYVYRTLNGVLDWYPLLTTQVDSRLDGGAF
jgi:hypothetical protein